MHAAVDGVEVAQRRPVGDELGRVACERRLQLRIISAAAFLGEPAVPQQLARVRDRERTPAGPGLLELTMSSTPTPPGCSATSPS